MAIETFHDHLFIPDTCKAAGADGLLIEAHDDPEHALTDGAQSITPKTLKDMMTTLKKIAAAVDREI
jgi:3-deoxy-7-phosphoheptulonate synthase